MVAGPWRVLLVLQYLGMFVVMLSGVACATSLACLSRRETQNSMLTLLQGILNTFGVFQTYYESGDLFQETSSNISWIGSVQ